MICPCCAVPVIAGNAVFAGEEGVGAGAGAGGGGEAGADELTTVVWLVVAGAEPVALVAVTVTRSVLPTSVAERVMPEKVSPPIAAQLAPALSQRFHW